MCLLHSSGAVSYSKILTTNCRPTLLRPKIITYKAPCTLIMRLTKKKCVHSPTKSESGIKMVCCLPYPSDAKCSSHRHAGRGPRSSVGGEGKGSVVGKQEALAFAPFPSVRTEREPRSKLRDYPLLCFSLGQMKSCNTKDGPRLSIAVACEYFCASLPRLGR